MEQSIPTVQSSIQNILSTAFDQQQILIRGCSRTDRAVNAYKYAFTFQLNNPVPKYSNILSNHNRMLRYINHINHNPDIQFYQLFQVDHDFDPLRNITQKEYLYKIDANLQNSKKCIFQQKRFVQPLFAKLDIDSFIRGTQIFVGTHNFYNFCQKNPQLTDINRYVKTIDSINTTFREGHNNIQHLKVSIKGHSFLRYQVRFIVGTLIQLATAKLTLQEIEQLLSLQQGWQEHKRMKADPKGLFLNDLVYQKLIDNDFYSSYQFNHG